MNLLCASLHARHFVYMPHFILTILRTWCCYAHFTDEENKAQTVKSLPEYTHSHEVAEAGTWLGHFNCKAYAFEERRRKIRKDGEERLDQNRKQIGFNEQIILDSSD